MHVELKGQAAAILKAKVAEGHFASIEEAVEAAILALVDEDGGDLSWAKPLLDEADRAISEGRTTSEKDAFADLEQRYGKI